MCPQTSRLFEVQDADKRQVHLIDVRSPIDDPTVIGMLTDNALRRLELVRPAPCLADTASEGPRRRRRARARRAEYGAMDTAPE